MSQEVSPVCNKNISKHNFEGSADTTFTPVSFQLEQAEETTERRRMLECEKISTEELQMRYKVTNLLDYFGWNYKLHIFMTKI